MAWPFPPLPAPCLEKLPEGLGNLERGLGLRLDGGSAWGQGSTRGWRSDKERTQPGGKANSGIRTEIGIQADFGARVEGTKGRGLWANFTR